MDAREYLVGMSRMCKSYDQCNGCELEDEPCDSIRCDHDRLIDVVSRWVKAHPVMAHSVRTRQSEFLRMYPNAPIGQDGLVALGMCDFDATYAKCTAKDCASCRKEYWLAPVEKEDESDGRS